MGNEEVEIVISAYRSAHPVVVNYLRANVNSVAARMEPIDGHQKEGGAATAFSAIHRDS